MTRLAWLLMVLGAFTFVVGCGGGVPEEREDVREAQQEAQENVGEERQETQEAAREGAKEIQEEKQELQEAKQEAQQEQQEEKQEEGAPASPAPK